LDLKRVLVNGTYGAIILTPVMHVYTTRVIPKLNFIQPPYQIPAKIAFDAVIAGPNFVAMYLFWHTILSGHGLTEAKNKLRDKWAR
jgi:hypothetical protein